MTYRRTPTGNGLGDRRYQPPTVRFFRALGMGLAMTTSAAFFSACSQGVDDDPRPGGDFWVGGQGGVGGIAGAGGAGGVMTDAGPVAVCQDGAKKECKVYIGETNGVITCFQGVQVCQDGMWGQCGNGVMTTIPKEDLPQEKPNGMSQDAWQQCLNNPCDPTCMVFEEDPDGGLKPNSQTPIFSWQTGDLGDYPPGLANKGLKEPCSTGSDCQFNQYCSAPVSGTCEHSKCAPGEALTNGCDTCVNEVCAIDQTCCKTSYGGTCAHDYCDQGATLSAGCDSCVTDICIADPKCCGLPTWGACSHDYCKTGTSLNSACDPCVTSICAKDPRCCGLNTTGTCSHGYCSTGAALVAGCDSCVAAICAAEPKCCDQTPGSVACAHDYCVTGTKLNAACDPCVAAVCATMPSCCNGSGNAWTTACRNLVATQCQQNDKCPRPSWTSSCVAKVASVCGNTCTASWGSTCTAKVGTVCGKSCTPPTWDQGCVNKVASVCGKSCGPFEWDSDCVDMVGTVCQATCYEDPPCAHDKCDTGAPLSAACDSCVASICAELPLCCTDEWTNLCVDRVKTKCGQGCPTKGDCTPWIPGQTDPDCPGYDLSLGIPCGDSVPVCNHGNTTVPAGVKVVHFPANSNQYPKCNPDQTHPQMKSCFTPLPIAPGKCINLPAASCDLNNGNREIMVNPPSFAGYTQVPECQCRDNWSLWSGPNVSCEPPSCSNTTTATVRRVNMFIAMDKSGSMNDIISATDTRWTATIKALKTFVQDPGSAGLSVALRFWPDNSPVSGCNETSCNATACKSPLVNAGVLTLQSAPADTHEQLLLNALNSKLPGGATPTYAALDGATQWAMAYKAANPNEEAIVVFATDGEPNGCNENETQISNLAGNAFNTGGVKTYAIGIQDANPALMNQIASKGGTGSAYFVSAGANVEYELLSALIEIKGNTLSCDFIVPQGGVYDPSAAKVIFTPTSGMPIQFANVGSAAACGNGWYYDDPADPSQIKLCPTTCQNVLNNSGAKIEVDLGCPGAYEPVTFKHQYFADCPTGTKAQWGFLAYDTLTPSDTNVVWKVRTGDTTAELGNATFVTAATSKASPDTQVCLMSGPSPCPINLLSTLGQTEGRKPYLELSITLNPAFDKSAAAKVNSWEITHSCPATE